MHFPLLALVVTFAVTAVAGGATVHAASVRGEIITLLSPNSAGGMMTRYARMIAPYIARHAGARDVRVRIMTGGGGIRGANALWYAEPDGRTIAFTSVTTLILSQLAGSEAVRFDATRFVFLGRAATEPRVLTVGAGSGIMSVDDARAIGRPFVFPSQGTDEDFYSMAVLADVLDIPLKVISGYNGNADTALAVIRGDGDGHITGWSASQAVIEAGDEVPILTLGQERLPRVARCPNGSGSGGRRLPRGRAGNRQHAGHAPRVFRPPGPGFRGNGGTARSDWRGPGGPATRSRVGCPGATAATLSRRGRTDQDRTDHRSQSAPGTDAPRGTGVHSLVLHQPDNCASGSDRDRRSGGPYDRAGPSLYARSAFAAKKKSLSVRPWILWVQISTTQRAQAMCKSGW